MGLLQQGLAQFTVRARTCRFAQQAGLVCTVCTLSQQLWVWQLGQKPCGVPALKLPRRLCTLTSCRLPCFYRAETQCQLSAPGSLCISASMAVRINFLC